MKKVLSVLITAALMLQLLAMFGAVSAEGSAAMTVTSASGTVGSTVTVDVGVVNNPGFHALQCEIIYDTSRMKLTGITVGDSLIPAPSLGIDDYFVSSTETASFVYRGIDLNESTQQLVSHLVSGDVNVATLTFELLATGAASVTVNCVAAVVLDDNAPQGFDIINTAPGTGNVTISEKPAYTRGDVDGNGVVDDVDAIHLLLHTLFGEEEYPINQSGDMDGNGTVDDVDAIHLLLHTLFGEEEYPLS